MENFLAFLKSHVQINTNIHEHLQEVCHQRVYKSGALILSPGDIQESLYFIQEGVIRAYSIMESYEWTSWFFSQGEFALSPNSFMFSHRSGEYFEACCPTSVLAINREDYYHLLEKHSELKKLKNLLAQSIFNQWKDKLFHLSHMSASKRYKLFVAQNQYIADRVQGKHLASFLGTNAESISRFRKQNTENRS